jgi:putative transposase
LTIIRLHAEGWTVTSIAKYLETTRRTVYLTLRRWVEEGVAGLNDKAPIPKQPARKVNLQVMNAVRQLQKNPRLGEFRIHAALLEQGIRLSPATCGRILTLNRALYGLTGPMIVPKEPKPMPFQAARRHQYWTVDIRYLDMHQLGGGMIYCISILENFSRAILASAVSRTQDLTAYLMVLYAAIRQHGSPEALVSDSGSVFKAKEAMRLYAALGIRKERIDKNQAWQSYIESQFNVQRRMADWHFEQATTWQELVAAHDQFVATFNRQVHWGHRERQDDRHSPAEVLGWVQGTQHNPLELHRIFYQTRALRWIDKLGYVRFRHWRLYSERGLAKQKAALWLYGETLTIEFSDQPLSQYAVQYEPDHRHFRTITDRRLFETQFQSPQQALWELGEGEWFKVLRVPPLLIRQRQPAITHQLPLFAVLWRRESMYPRTSYLVCGTPRSGTSLLCEALKATGIAGCPEEYFWSGNEVFLQERWGISTNEDYLWRVLEEGTTPNGVFGAKVMWGYFDDLIARLRQLLGPTDLPSPPLIARVFPNLHYIFIRRRWTCSHDR